MLTERRASTLQPRRPMTADECLSTAAAWEAQPVSPLRDAAVALWWERAVLADTNPGHPEVPRIPHQ